MDMLDPAHCYPALLARDARFDGRWFVGVTSTGIYCRPVCRVRTPKAANCRFFSTAAQAEAQRYRPCLKCRPERAPGHDDRWSVMDASATLARQAAALLDAGETDSIEALALRLGISSRHLHRIFTAEQGVTPMQYLQTRRLLLAKHLLTDTSMPVIQVAEAAGFHSLRRFNAAFAEHYRLQPTALRREGGASASTGMEPALRLDYRAPLAVEALLNFLAARAIPGIESVNVAARTLTRSLRVQHGGLWLAGHIVARFDATTPVVLLSPGSTLWPAAATLVPLVRRWLDLNADPESIDTCLGALAAEAPGLRLPGAVDRFELAVRGVLGQQVTVAAARTLARRLVERFGETLVEGAASGDVQRLFPTPERMAVAEISEIAELGIIRRRAETIIAFAQGWAASPFARGEGSVTEAFATLCELPGIGPWTAHYLLMRGWSWPDAFPPGDVVLKKQLAGSTLNPEQWQPYRSYAVLHLWRLAALNPKVKS